MKTVKTLMAAAAMVAMTGTAQAALMDLGDGTVKDGLTNLIWLKDWNFNGSANWAAQMAWAEGLNFADSTDWRLPEISEYDALFAAYGNLTQTAVFTDVQSPYYWSGTELAPSSGAAFRFLPTLGGDGSFASKSFDSWAVAVRPGDVTAAVPEPGTLALFGMGLLGLLGLGRARRPLRSRLFK